MRFMVIVKATKESETGILPKPEAFAAMQKYNEELVKAGILLAAEGLAASSKGARVKFSGDERTVIDGPFAEAKELIAGYSIWEVSSMDEAVEWAKRSPLRGVVELRKILDADDFSDAFAAEITAAEERLRAETAAS